MKYVSSVHYIRIVVTGGGIHGRIKLRLFYLIAGLTDMLDGILARRWGVESKFGARLDSLADFVFVLAVGYKLLRG